MALSRRPGVGLGCCAGRGGLGGWAVGGRARAVRRALDLGAAACFHTAVLADHPQDVLAALEAGTAAGKNVTVRPADGEHYRFYLSELPGPDELHTLLPHPLGLAGYREPR